MRVGPHEPDEGSGARAARGAASPSDTSTADIERLAAVLGRARARVLIALRQPRTTDQVAKAIGAASSTASEHLTALANAGLATRRREQRLVYYELSERGHRLVELLGSDTDF